MIGRTAETEIVYDRSRTRRHKACPSFAQRAPSPGRRPGVAKYYSYVCKCHYIESRPPFRPAYIHTDRPENPARLPRPGLRVVDFARGRAGFSCWRFTGEQLHLLLLMRPGSFARSRLRDREKEREKREKGDGVGPRSRRTGRGVRRDSRGMKMAAALILWTAFFAYSANNRLFRTRITPMSRLM